VDTLTLTARGCSVTLFAPRDVPGGVEAFAFYATAPLTRVRTLITPDKRRFRAPAGLPSGFRLGRVFMPEEGE
jgi:hypothetical protein